MTTSYTIGKHMFNPVRIRYTFEPWYNVVHVQWKSNKVIINLSIWKMALFHNHYTMAMIDMYLSLYARQHYMPLEIGYYIMSYSLSSLPPSHGTSLSIATVIFQERSADSPAGTLREGWVKTKIRAERTGREIIFRCWSRVIWTLIMS